MRGRHLSWEVITSRRAYSAAFKVDIAIEGGQLQVILTKRGAVLVTGIKSLCIPKSMLVDHHNNNMKN